MLRNRQNETERERIDETRYEAYTEVDMKEQGEEDPLDKQGCETKETDLQFQGAASSSSTTQVHAWRRQLQNATTNDHVNGALLQRRALHGDDNIGWG